METEEFFDKRTEEEIGGDTEQTSIEVKRLQTHRPDRSTRGRVILTLHYDIPKNLWGERDTDAVDYLRREIDTVTDVLKWLEQELHSDSLVVDVDVDATK